MLLYSLLYLTGFPGMTIEQIENFRQWGSITPGHPEYGHTPGVETTTGPLGQGVATAVGMAMAERSLAAKYGPKLVDHHTWVVAGDGCLMEGVSHEAAHLAGRLKLAKLTVLFDDNDTTIDGRATIAETGDQVLRFKAAGWATKRISGHDYGQIARALSWAKRQDRPTFIACKTMIEQGRRSDGGRRARPRILPVRQGDRRGARLAMGWHAPPFVIPDDIAKAWRKAGRRGRARPHRPGPGHLQRDDRRADFERAIYGDLPPTPSKPSTPISPRPSPTGPPRPPASGPARRWRR